MTDSQQRMDQKTINQRQIEVILKTRTQKRTKIEVIDPKLNDVSLEEQKRNEAKRHFKYK